MIRQFTWSSHYITYMTQFWKTTLVAQNNKHFKHSLSGHYISEATEIWCPGRPVSAPLRFQISLASCAKWPNSECLKVSVC